MLLYWLEFVIIQVFFLFNFDYLDSRLLDALRPATLLVVGRVVSGPAGQHLLLLEVMVVCCTCTPRDKLMCLTWEAHSCLPVFLYWEDILHLAKLLLFLAERLVPSNVD